MIKNVKDGIRNAAKTKQKKPPQKIRRPRVNCRTVVDILHLNTAISLSGNNTPSLTVSVLSKSDCLVPKPQTNIKFGFSSSLYFSFHLLPPPSSAFLSQMSALRSLRQLSVATSRAVALRSAPVARLRLPTLAARVSVPATRTFSVSARSLAEGSCQYHLTVHGLTM